MACRQHGSVCVTALFTLYLLLRMEKEGGRTFMSPTRQLPGGDSDNILRRGGGTHK